MKALTIWRPWTWAMCHPSDKAKRTENRTWAAPWMLEQQVAIHAGQRVDDPDAFDFIEEILGERPPTDCPTGIVAVATIAGFVHHNQLTSPPDDPWLVGPVGWQLRDVIVLPREVPCRGAQGLWLVPAMIAGAVADQLRAGLAATRGMEPK